MTMCIYIYHQYSVEESHCAGVHIAVAYLIITNSNTHNSNENHTKKWHEHITGHKW